MMSTLINDVNYGIRQLIKNPGFAVIAILTLGFGIGACTVMFSLVNAVILRPLPFPESGRLVWLQNDLQGDTLSHRTLRVDNFLDYRAQSQSFEGLAAYHAFSVGKNYSLTSEGEAQRLHGVRVSQNFLDVLGVQPFLGRNFVKEECVGNGRRAAIVSNGFWQRKFGSAKDVIGHAVTVNGESVSIVGVLPPSSNLDILFSQGADVELLFPFPLTEETATWGNVLFGIGRLKSGVTFEQAKEELAVINTRLHMSNPERNNGEFGVRAIVLDNHIRGAFRPAFALLSGAVLCVLLIICVNLSNLLLARANARRQEFAVRIALGASRWRLIRQTMTESLLLASTGCLLGVLGAAFAMVPIARLQAFSIPLLHTASSDAPTLIVAVALAFMSAFFCSVLPALQLWRRQTNEVLHDTGTRGNTGKGMIWTRRTLVISEMALACILLIGTGLLTRSFVKVLQVNLGFQPESMFAWHMETTRSFNSVTERVQFYNRLAERVSAIPGVESVGLSDFLPLGHKRAWSLRASGVIYEPNNYSQAYVRMVDHRCLQTMRIALLAGRYFNDRDIEESQEVTIISETAARYYWSDQNPIGQTIETNGHTYTVVGVVADIVNGLEEAPQPNFYLNMRQVRYWDAPQLVIRSKLASAALIPNVRATIKEFDPMLPSNEFTMLDHIVDRAIAPRRLITGLLSSFSSFALLLAAVGLYGIIAYSVGQRTREIGIRMALGAQRANVLRLVLGEGLRMAGIGVAIGLVVAFFATRILQNQLYGITAGDPFTYAFTAVILVAVALLACYVPARRAAKTDPMEALRDE
jgi:predicted permease